MARTTVQVESVVNCGSAEGQRHKYANSSAARKRTVWLMSDGRPWQLFGRRIILRSPENLILLGSGIASLFDRALLATGSVIYLAQHEVKFFWCSRSRIY